MTDWPTSLIERIKARQAILVAGLGCSRLVGRPGWAELGERLVDWLDDEEERGRVRALLAAGRIATAITFLRARLADDVVVEVLKDAYPQRAGAGAPPPRAPSRPRRRTRPTRPTIRTWRRRISA